MAGSASTDKAQPDRRRLRGYVLDRSEFNEMRARLPRAVRRAIDPAPQGHVGLVA